MEKTTVKQPNVGPKVIWQGKHYRVVTAVLPDLHETPQALKVKYIVDCPEDGVIYGLSSSRGQAIVAGLQADAEWEKAEEILAEEAAKAGQGGSSEGTDGDIVFPRLQ